MRVLGIGDGFGAGAALVEDGAVKFVVSEERLSRIKNHSGYYHGFPYGSIQTALESMCWGPESLDHIAVSNHAFPPLPLRILALSRSKPLGEKEFLSRNEFSRTVNSRLYSLVSERESDSLVGRGSISIYRTVLARKLNERFRIDKPIVFVDHHRAHASSAYYTQEEDDCLVVTMDCHGDGLSGSVSIGSGGRLNRIAKFPASDSLGSFYAAITNHLGFEHHRHEGKVTGLAAYGDPRVAEEDVKRMISYDPATRRLTNRLGRNQFISIRNVGRFFTQAYKPEDIAAAAQAHLERLVLQIVTDFLSETGKRKILLAGGIFANVKLNQRINELPQVGYIYIHAGMGDEGLPVGAALASSAAKAPFERRCLDNSFLGPGFEDDEIKQTLAASGLPHVYAPNIEQRVAEALASKQIVARFNGRMEYGPRALGNRSILFHAGDRSVNDWLNKKLRRTEFMPFAPATLKERAADCYRGVETASYTAEFMTICFDCSPRFSELCPAVVHVDGTARPQLVDREGQESFHRTIAEYEKLTGIASVINTSFNIHEEPIVCTPHDAIRAFEMAELDCLAIGNYLVSRTE